MLKIIEQHQIALDFQKLMEFKDRHNKTMNFTHEHIYNFVTLKFFKYSEY